MLYVPAKRDGAPPLIPGRIYELRGPGGCEILRLMRVTGQTVQWSVPDGPPARWAYSSSIEDVRKLLDASDLPWLRARQAQLKAKMATLAPWGILANAAVIKELAG
jgi:hypothetical protein